MTIYRPGTGLNLRHPSQIPLSVFLLLVVGYTAVAPNFDQPFINYGFASAVIFLFVVPSRSWTWIVTIAAAVAFGIFHAFIPRFANTATQSVSLYAGLLGRGALAALGLTAIWTTPKESPRLLRIFLLPLGIISFVLASLLALNLTVATHSRVLDFYLYIFDGSLGFQPSFLFGRLLLRHKLFAEFVRTAYFALPVFIGLACAGYLRYRTPWRPLAILASAGVLGYLLYFVFPATGPLYVAGASFPNSPHPFAALRQVHPHSIALSVPVPRNAIPSLHMAWALLLCFNSRPFSRTVRGLALAYVLLTIVGTLGTGEHYLADLAVAFPFSVAVQAGWTHCQPLHRNALTAAAASLTLMWLALLRYGSNLFLVSPAVPWGCILVSTIASLLLLRQLRSRERANVDPPEPAGT
ncbi:MAG: phosphatase PAP2 family protein [Candidatus Sulfotelmatobacter sp.]